MLDYSRESIKRRKSSVWLMNEVPVETITYLTTSYYVPHSPLLDFQWGYQSVEMWAGTLGYVKAGEVQVETD